MKKNKVGKCYLCGTQGEMTKEHIPPKFVSPKSPNSDFAKVSVCLDCNNKNSHEESKFRDFLATASAFKGSKEADEAYLAMKRSFMKNPAARIFMGPSIDLIRIFKSIEIKDVYTKSGKIYLGKTRVITPSDDLDWEKILIKIARSLQFLYNGEVVPENYIMHAEFINQINRPDLFAEAKVIGRAGDFFHFRGGWSRQDSKSGLWYMMFYQKIAAIAWFINPSAVKNKPKYLERF